MTLVVAVLPCEPDQIVVQALTKSSPLAWNEIAYVSLIMQEIRALYQQISIDRYNDHPILRISAG